MNSRSSHSDASQYDSVFVNSRRETFVLLAGFAVFFVWSIGASYLLGYAKPLPADGVVATVMGMPHWVFWGVAIPWCGANVFTFWFCLFYMTDDPLGESLTESQPVDGAASGDLDTREGQV